VEYFKAPPKESERGLTTVVLGWIDVENESSGIRSGESFVTGEGVADAASPPLHSHLRHDKNSGSARRLNWVPIIFVMH
jgi:hypothetical protein